MEEEKKEENKIVHHNKRLDLTNKIRKNPWILATIIVTVLCLVLLSSILFGSNISGKVISADSAGKKLLNFYESMGITGLTLESVKEVSGLYEVNLSYEGEIVSLYVTKDGKGAIESVIPIEPQIQTNNKEDTITEIPLSEKPSVELYVYTYCPFGTQAEKGIIPVIDLLKDKVDFKIRQIGAMHGEHEKLEAERQLCIEKNYPTKLLDYVLEFAENSSVGSCNGDANCVNPIIQGLYSKLGIDGKKIDACIKSEGETLYNTEVENSKSNRVSGSPTLVINGVEVSMSSDNRFYAFNDKKIPFSRSAETYKQVICSLFTTSPSECEQVLSTDSPSAGFGSSSGSSSAASC